MENYPTGRSHQQAVNSNNNNNNTMLISSMATLEKIQNRRKPNRISSQARCIFYDKTYPGYEWLLPGWVAEERHMNHGRIYRYFYDPNANKYNTKGEVLHAWEEAGLVILDE